MPVTQVAEPSALQAFFNSAFVTYSLKIIGAVIAIIVLLMISKVIANLVRKKFINTTSEDKNADKVWKIVHDITFTVLIIFSFFIGFQMVGFDVGLILGGVSFGIWLAFKQVLGNIVAGIMILYTKEFKIGDLIEVEADQSYFGRIEGITIRYTIIRTADMRQVVLPNMTLISVPIKTYSAEPLVKLSVVQRSDYDTDRNKAMDIMKEAVNSIDFVKNKEKTKVFVNCWDDSYVEYKAFFEFDPNCWFWLYYEIAEAQVSQKVYEAFLANGIDCPYPIQTLDFENRDDQRKIQEEIAGKIKKEIQAKVLEPTPVKTSWPVSAGTPGSAPVKAPEPILA